MFRNIKLRFFFLFLREKGSILSKTKAKMGSQATAIFWLSLLLTAIALTGCAATQMPESLPPTKPSTIASQTPEFSPPRKLPTSVNGMDQVLLIDEWPKGGFPMDAAKIMTVALEKNILKINITYQGGCQEHIFVLLAQTAFLMSNPPQGELYLSHDAHGDACTETIEKHLSFDLTLFRPTDPRMHPALLRVYAPVSGAFANEPYMPLAEWP